MFQRNQVPQFAVMEVSNSEQKEGIGSTDTFVANCPITQEERCNLNQCFSTAGPRSGTGPWHQLYWAARGL